MNHTTTTIATTTSTRPRPKKSNGRPKQSAKAGPKLKPTFAALMSPSPSTVPPKSEPWRNNGSRIETAAGCSRSTLGNDEYIPTPQQIEEACEAIRDSWSPSEFYRRRKGEDLNGYPTERNIVADAEQYLESKLWIDRETRDKQRHHPPSSTRATVDWERPTTLFLHDLT